MHCDLQKISQKLITEALIPQDQSAFCGAYGRNIKLYFPEKNSGQTGVFVKCSQHNGVENEFLILRRVADHFNGYALKPLHFWREGSFSVAAYPLQRFEPMKPGQLDQPAIVDQLIDIFDRLFSQNQLFQEQRNISDESLISFYVKSGLTFFNPMKKYFLRSLQVIRKKYGKISQHGDFSVNNLAVDSKGSLVLLDWEDFGRINYPFFDLATLAFCHVVDQNKDEELGNNPSVLSDILKTNMIAGICQKQGMSMRSFQGHFPFFMMLFACLKQDLCYDDYIISRVTKFLDQVSTSKGWATILRP